MNNYLFKNKISVQAYLNLENNVCQAKMQLSGIREGMMETYGWSMS